MENVLAEKTMTNTLEKHYQDTIRRLSVPVVAEVNYAFAPQSYRPFINEKKSSGILLFVMILHIVAIYYLAQKQIVTQAKMAPAKPILVSLIAPPAPEPVLVPVIEPPKPVIQPKPKLKKIVNEIKPIEMPAERLVEATTEEVKDLAPPAPVQVSQEAVETKTPPKADPALEEKIEPPKFGVAYLNNPAPTYPSLSRRKGEEGRALLRVLVSETGEATEVQLEKSSGSERLDQAAVDAVKNWRFIPARKGSQALSAYVLVPIKFSLNS
jgi:periplasmic protein TonB